VVQIIVCPQKILNYHEESWNNKILDDIQKEERAMLNEKLDWCGTAASLRFSLKINFWITSLSNFHHFLLRNRNSISPTLWLSNFISSLNQRKYIDSEQNPTVKHLPISIVCFISVEIIDDQYLCVVKSY
jgi:hypothetical protein